MTSRKPPAAPGGGLFDAEGIARPGRQPKPEAHGPPDHEGKAKQPREARELDVFSTTGTIPRVAPDWRAYDRQRSQPYRVDNTKLGTLQARALAGGGGYADPYRDGIGRRPSWDISGKGVQRCLNPVLVVLHSAEGKPTPVGYSIEYAVRCRKCEACLKARASYWKMSAMAEISKSTRTWFCTFTFGPSERVRLHYAAGLQLAKAGITKPTPDEIYKALIKEAGSRMTNYFRMVRKGHAAEPKVSLRYLVVWEAHKDGFPHAHALIYEVNGQTLLKERLERHWRFGFSNIKLVDPDPEQLHKAAAYVCKYISKSMLTRVRASLGHGSLTTISPPK